MTRQTTSWLCRMSLLATLALPGLAAAQTVHPSAEAAADALISALARSDDAALPVLLGPAWRSLLPPGGLSSEDRFNFLEKSAQVRNVNVTGARAELAVGKDPYVLPIPIVQGADGLWRFDGVAARDEMALRRLGRNERSAMQAALAYVDAQRDYALADRNGDGVLEYAQKLISSPGRRDGLIWSPSLGDDSPLGEAFMPPVQGQGYHGYQFRILTRQGAGAPGGAADYMIGKRLVSGYALVAWPVQYGKTGVMSFIVNQNGTVYERDLGPQSAQLARGLKSFDPADGWKPAKM